MTAKYFDSNQIFIIMFVVFVIALIFHVIHFFGKDNQKTENMDDKMKSQNEPDTNTKKRKLPRFARIIIWLFVLFVCNVINMFISPLLTSNSTDPLESGATAGIITIIVFIPALSMLKWTFSSNKDIKSNTESSEIIPQSESAKPKVQFCGKCGSKIDPVNKKCTGCGIDYN